MKDFFSATYISKVIGVKSSAIRKRAKKENWNFKSLNGRGRSGERREYCFRSLPQDYQAKIISNRLGCSIDLVSSKNPDFSHAKACLNKWGRSSNYNKKIAQAREHILKKLSQFIETKGFGQGQGEERFASYYNAGLIKEVPPWVIEKISTVSAPTLRRWRSAKEKSGLPGLLGNYGTRKGAQKAVTSEQSAFIISHIKAKPHIRAQHIYKIVCKTFEVHPSRRTVYRFVNNWKKENEELFALIEDPRRWKNSYMSAFGDAGADTPHFGHTWEMDSSPADIITKDGKRLTVIGTIDVFSRRAVMLIAPTSKSIAIAACMRKAMIAWGVPTRIRKDNGQDYQSFHVDAITSSLKIDTPELPKYAPEKKPFIERFFGTFAAGFEELLPGYVGHSVAGRKALQAKELWSEKIMKSGGTIEVPLTMKEFQSLTDRWIEVYEKTPHRGINGKTPLDIAKGSTLQPEKIRDTRILDILLAPICRRTVQKQGISVDGEFFRSPELNNYIKTKVEIRRDLSNAGLLYVFDALTGKYLCQANNGLQTGRSLEDNNRAKKEHFKNLKGRAKALDKMGLSNRNPLQILLEDEIENSESNVILFQRNFENGAVKEAKKAVEDAAAQVDEAPQQISKAVNYYNSDDLLNFSGLTQEDINFEAEELKRRQAMKRTLVSR